MPHKVYIVEDEPNALERMHDLLKTEHDIIIVGSAGNVEKAIAEINSLSPDILLLDIQISGGTGFDVLNRLHSFPSVIFVTAYDQYAIRAFEENAVDYILKPYSGDRLLKAIRKVTAEKKVFSEELLSSIQHLLRKNKYLRRIPVKFPEEIIIIPIEEICFFKAEDKYVFGHTNDKEYIIDFTLKELETQLDPERFVRIHKSYIVAIDKIVKLKKWFFGELIVVINDKDHHELKVSRTFASQLKKKIGI